jgi:hypothetical protein
MRKSELRALRCNEDLNIDTYLNLIIITDVLRRIRLWETGNGEVSGLIGSERILPEDIIEEVHKRWNTLNTSWFLSPAESF